VRRSVLQEMAVADTRRARGKKRSQPGSSSDSQPKKIGRPPKGGTPCSQPGCINKAQSKGRCRTHSGGGKCSHPDCDKQAQFKGLCAAHGGRRICSHPGCDKKVASKGKCGDHGGGGRPSRQRAKRTATRSPDLAGDGALSTLVSAAAVMPTMGPPNPSTQGSMLSLLLQDNPPEVPMPGTIYSVQEGAQASDIVSEVIL
jgi:hypothetical protein